MNNYATLKVKSYDNDYHIIILTMLIYYNSNHMKIICNMHYLIIYICIYILYAYIFI